MAKLTYPKELTKKQYSKDKPLLAGGKETGIGAALEELEDAFDKTQWSVFDTPAGVKKCDDELKLLPERCRVKIDPLIKLTKAVKEAAAEGVAKFKKEKMVGKTAEKAVTACNNVLEAAKAFLVELEDFEGAHALDVVEARKQSLVAVKKSLKPQVEKSLKKMKALLEDIKTFAKNPTEKQFFTTFEGDHNGRGFTTACKFWDQTLIEFPELRKLCYDGDAMKDFFPSFQVYGDRWDDPKLFEKRVNEKIGLTGDEAAKYHAKQMLLNTKNIQTFIAAHEKLLKLLNG